MNSLIDGLLIDGLLIHEFSYKWSSYTWIHECRISINISFLFSCSCI